MSHIRRLLMMWWTVGLGIMLAAPAGAVEDRRFAVVSVQCPRQPVVLKKRSLLEQEALMAGGSECRERIVAIIDPQTEPTVRPAAVEVSERKTIQHKPGWPRTFLAFSGGSLTLAELGDSRGLVTVVDMEDGTIHALAPDGQSLPGWPVPLPAVTDVSAVLTAVDLLGDFSDELFLLPGFVHVLSSEGELLPGWPFTGAGSIGIPIGARIAPEGPVRVVFAGRLPLPFPEPGGVFVLDEGGAVLPGWPALVPPFVTERGTFPPIFQGPAVGDLTGDEIAEVVVINSNDRGVWVFDAMGEKIPPFPVRIGRILDAPSLGDLDGDGSREIVFWTDRTNPDVRGSRGIIVLKRDGSVMTGWPQVTNAIGNFGPALGDVDGDGLPEVVALTLGGAGVGEAGGGVYVWQNDGTPLPGWPKFIDFAGFANSPTIADVDGDGMADIVATGRTSFLPSDGVIFAWNGTGDLIAGFPIIIPFRPISLNGSAVVADIDRDGITDLGVTTEPGVFQSKPARIHWYDLGVPYRPEGMEWPTWAHDNARTGSYSPPVRRIGMKVMLTPALLHENLPAPPVTVVVALPDDEDASPASLFLDKVDGSPVERLEGTALGGNQAGRLVFRFDGEEVRTLLPSPGTHALMFRSEVIGGLGGIQYQGAVEVTSK